jgi:hypothetical protein
MIMGEIAEHDFPEQWPNLVTNLLHLFENSNPTAPAASSSLKCLLLVSQHFHDKQIQHVFPNLVRLIFNLVLIMMQKVPYMMRMSIDERYPPRTRARGLQIVNQLFKLLAMLLGAYEDGNFTYFKMLIFSYSFAITTCSRSHTQNCYHKYLLIYTHGDQNVLYEHYYDIDQEFPT